MPRKKTTSPPPVPSVRRIQCAFCQKELNPPTDDVTFIGVGKWRDGPGYFHAVCSAKTPDGQETPCFLSGMSWATNNVKQEPVCMTFEEWKARPIRRSASATSAANGRYELHLIESHLNCVYFVETKHAANAEKAKEVVGRWQADWGLSPEDMPDIDQSERDARHAKEVQRIQNMRLNEVQPDSPKVEFAEESKKELHRHSDRHIEHFRSNILADGDDCKSCRISRGMKKLHAIAVWGPVIEQTLDTMRMVKESGASFGCFMSDLRKIFDDATKSLCHALDIKPNDEKHNEAARKRNEKDIRLAKALVEEYGVKS